jgi:predicted GNAT superfamily acetyltransferase
MSGPTDLVRGQGTSVAAARAAADAAIHAAGVQVRTIDAIGDLDAVRRLFERIWRTGAANPPVTADLLKAMVAAGSYVSGAYADGELVGACVAFFGPPGRASLHSHITGVLAGARSHNLGFALKLHQRAWALARGAADITWTFDPLVRRNAYFNLAKLAAGPTAYLPDFYGAMDDAINRSDPTDRLMVRWPLAAPEVVAACAGTPRVVAVSPHRSRAIALDVAADGGPLLRIAHGPTVLVGVPTDIEVLREQDRSCAADWRSAVREVLGGLLGAGGRVRGFDRAGWYVVDLEERP